MQTHLANGSTEPAAQAAALADLGDAHAAAACFRREHLTIQETVIVGYRISKARDTGPVFYWQVVSLICSIFTSLALIVDWAYEPARDGRCLFFAAVLLALVLTCASLGIAVDVLARRKPALATARQIFLLGDLKGLIQNILPLTTFIIMPLVCALPLTLNLLLMACGGIVGMNLLRRLKFYAPMSIINFRLRKKLVTACEDDYLRRYLISRS